MSILCLLDMKFLMKMVLGKFREHPVLGGSEVFSELGTETGKLHGRPVFVQIKIFMKMILGKFHEHPVFVVN